VGDEDVAAFGYRDHEEQARAGSQPVAPDILVLDLPVIRDVGLEVAIRDAVHRLSRPELDGFLIHLDADVLADEIMPAVDARVPGGGLTPEEVVSVLRAAMNTGRAAGIEITIYNPNLDPDGALGRMFTDLVVDGLAG
jgi:arginase